MVFEHEVGIVVYTDTILDIQIGSLTAVEFNFLKIWEGIKEIKQREKFKIEYLHFLHIHPESIGTHYSATDIDCMKGLNIAFGYPCKFFIGCFQPMGFELKGYQYVNGNVLEISNIEKQKYWYFQEEYLTPIKTLCYANQIKQKAGGS